jgi:hypothetical protein
MKVRKEFVASSKVDARYEHFLRGGNVAPYSCDWRGAWVCYDKALEPKYTNQAFRERITFDAGDKLLVRLVYDLYSLTEEEIKQVEGASC